MGAWGPMASTIVTYKCAISFNLADIAGRRSAEIEAS
jgi:hypothetical protein